MLNHRDTEAQSEDRGYFSTLRADFCASVSLWFGRASQFFLLICLLCGAGAGAAVARADQLHLKDGRVVEVEEVWETSDSVWFRQGKMMLSVAKADVARIVRSTSVNASKLNIPIRPGAASDEASAGKLAPHPGARIVLKSGTQLDADAVWEYEDRIGYRLGNMQTFIDRGAVEQVTREVVSAGQPAAARPSLRFTTGHAGLDQLIVSSAARHAVDPLLIYLVMHEESGFNHRAVSRVGARGLMQLMPETAWRLGVRNIHDPVENVEAGTRYLKSLIDLFAGDVNLALAAYNAGEAAVLRYGHRVPPYRETQSYVRRINLAYRRMASAKF